jgi:hypothetical protein
VPLVDQVLVARPKFVSARAPARFVSVRRQARFVSVSRKQIQSVVRGSGGVIVGGSSGSYAVRRWNANGVMAPFTKNRFEAPNIVVATPLNPNDFDDFMVVVSDPANAGCSIPASAGQTIDGGALFSIDIVPSTLWFSWDQPNLNWVKIGVTT